MRPPEVDVLETGSIPRRARPTSGIAVYAYLVVAASLVAYVALCTWNWDNRASTDAWEHHRAIVAMANDLWSPGNPTYATAEPSIRYSPYTLVLAVIVRTTGIDAFTVLCLAAIANTILLVVALYVLLRTYSMERYAAPIAIVMVALWGGPPGYANSYALADLPWHQVNPSALAFPLCLLMMSVFERSFARNAFFWPWLSLSLLGSIALLSHGMTGVFGFLAIGSILVSRLSDLPFRHMALLVATALTTFALCAAWPWYSFIAAIFLDSTRDHWYTAPIASRMLTEWCMPALMATFFTLRLHTVPLVRVCIIGATVCFGLAVVMGGLFHSAVMARIPMPAMIFLHVPIGIWLADSGVFDPSTWPSRLRDLIATNSARSAPAAAQLVVVAAVTYFLVPQLWMIVSEPHLARPYVAALTGREDKQRPLKPIYDELMAGMPSRAVVLGPPLSMWPVPSSGGRIVSALHRELFTRDQDQRAADTEAFFSDTTNEKRLAILDRYHVQYLLLDPTQMDTQIFRDLYDENAVVRSASGLVLLDAARWRADRDVEAAPVAR